MAAEQIAVLAGTPVDTQMGVDCLARAGLNGLAFPLASDPPAADRFPNFLPGGENSGGAGCAGAGAGAGL